jgi:feruloyl esterase
MSRIHSRPHGLNAAIAALATMCLASPSAFASRSCEALAHTTLPGVKVTMSQIVPAGMFTPPDSTTPVSIPFAFCRVSGSLKPVPTSDILFEVWMPLENWNGKFNHGGNGGYGGSFVTPDGLMVQGLLRGYAVTGTNMGHSAANAAWALNSPVQIHDWAYRANHLTSIAAKALTTLFYGKPPRLSYFTGCSDGGHEGLMEAQRYPEDYDGIVAGAPANWWTHQADAWTWEAQATLNDPASYIPVTKLPVITAAAAAACAGPVPGFVDNPLTCNFDPQTLLCPAGTDGPTCLTQPQVDAVKKIYAGPVDPVTGEQIYPGLEPGSEASTGLDIGASWTALISGPVPFLSNDFLLYMVYDDPNYDFHTFDFHADVAFADDKLHKSIDSTSPNLDAFERRGSKLILYHGWADPLVNPRNSINYYESVVSRAAAHGSADALRDTQKFARLFMAPGMAHCAEGQGLNTFDTLTALESWVEHRIAPDQLSGSHTTLPFPINVESSALGTFTRPICAYPKVATWTGQGDPKEESNYKCE